jgi:hypothetical protein
MFGLIGTAPPFVSGALAISVSCANDEVATTASNPASTERDDELMFVLMNFMFAPFAKGSPGRQPPQLQRFFFGRSVHDHLHVAHRVARPNHLGCDAVVRLANL